MCEAVYKEQTIKVNIIRHIFTNDLFRILSDMQNQIRIEREILKNTPTYVHNDKNKNYYGKNKIDCRNMLSRLITEFSLKFYG